MSKPENFLPSKRVFNAMYFPVFLDLRGKQCLIVGNGHIGTRKARALKAAGAKVTLIERGSRPNPNKYFLVVIATSNRTFNARLARQCLNRGQLVNVVDDPELCNFIYPSRFKSGPLEVAVSTGGASPALARHIRQTLKKQWGKSWAQFLTFLEVERKKIMRKVDDPAKRRKILMRAASKKIISLIHQGKLAEAKREFLTGVS